MSSLRALLIVLLLLASGLWLGMLDQKVAAQQTHDPAPMEVTTDTPEYCVYLQDRLHTLEVAAVAPPPHEVTDLSAEGRRMCNHGQTRGGIMRLRRALLILRHDDPPASR
ncbi:hypothetical protein [Rhodopila globiformis]|uniref:Uncharacterized protein n=1 Tax=Rhodopila globiformis TaxID=1071 RepID=A0A2S6NLS5_RHOGL|nr:hypothetical protein [Rhodopila globiformis]PPQ36462.1 hypothetical protein CCS01_04960 [Rhodopila globiformis]